MNHPRKQAIVDELLRACPHYRPAISHVSLTDLVEDLARIMRAEDVLPPAAPEKTDCDALECWAMRAPGVRTLLVELRRIDQLEGNEGSANFWAGYLFAELWKQRKGKS